MMRPVRLSGMPMDRRAIGLLCGSRQISMAKVPSVMHVYRQRRFPSTRKLFSTLSKPSTADPGESSQKPGKESLWSEIKSIAAIARPEALTMSAGVFLLVISSAVRASAFTAHSCAYAPRLP